MREGRRRFERARGLAQPMPETTPTGTLEELMGSTKLALPLLLATTALGAATAPGCTFGAARCGDGRVNGDEDCEPPGSQGCDQDCHVGAVCGDFVVTAPEQCEPPNSATCGPTCMTIGGPGCGDGVVQPPEQCEPPSTSTCNAACMTIGGGGLCGDGVVGAGEQCEPPNTSTCSSSCQSIGGGACGNGLVEPPEQCDPPDGFSCGAGCVLLGGFCGDGIIDPGEECDPPDGVTCDFGCRILFSSCGNGFIDPGETCDPPDFVTCDGFCQIIGSGTAAPGDPCVVSSDCAPGALGQTVFCLDEASSSVPGGFCLVLDCTIFPGGGDDCPAPSRCEPFDDGMGGSLNLCLPACTPSSGGLGGCRADASTTYGYACYPRLDDPADGYCWVGCVSDALCNYCDTTTSLCSDGATTCSSDATCSAAANIACDATQHLCYPDHAAGAAAIGAPCSDMLDCPPYSWCNASATSGPGGYCTQYYCGSFTDPQWTCPAGSVCPAATGGAVNLCAAACTVDGGNSTCDTARGDAFDYECADATVAAGAAATSYYAAVGAAGYCWQCEDLVPGGAGCP
jgi:hypothetical protein